MAQGVQVQAPPALNDENSSSTTAVLRSNNKPGAPPLQLSARKAFGNISSNLSKQPTARRALGDISNSAAKPPAGRTASKATSSLFAMPQKAAAAAAPAPAVPAAAADKASSAPASTEQATTSTTASATNSSKPAWWEELEPERVAGKTWEQQLAQEDAAVDAEAKQAADQIWQAVFRGGSGGMFGFLARPLSKGQESEEEDDTSYPPVEAPCRQLEGPCNLAPLPDVALEELTYPSDYDFASLLPDIDADDDGDGEGDRVEQTSAAEVQQLAESLAAASLRDGGGGVGCSSPAGAGGSSGQQQQSSQDCCMSPEVLPW